MIEKISDLFPRIIISIPFGIGTIFLFVKGLKLSNRFFFRDYRGNSKERFRENLLSSLYIGLGIACLMVAFMGFLYGAQNIKAVLGIIPFALCMGAFLVPVSILGGYWRSYQMNKLWGGFLPTVRAYYGYAQNESTTQKKIDASKIKVPRRITISAAAIALWVFFGMLYFLSKVEWNGPVWVGILVLLLFSGLSSFSVFLMIVSTSLSRRIQKLRDGEPLDDD
jgi:hypothetical protein